MELWAHIKGKDYPIEYGAVFNEELSETLDSGTVKLPHVFEEIDIKPYDDVIVHSYGVGGLTGKRSFSSVFVPEEGEFYKHMLAYDITREQLTLDEGFNYQISLISETKGLEKTILPDISILQPQEGLVFKVGDKIRDYIELYSPKLKVVNKDGETWDYIQKYRISSSVVNYFNDTFAPEIMLSQPTLREVINQLMQIKDCICVVHDGWVEYVNVSKRNDYVNTEEDPTCASRLWMMNGDSYCDKLKRNYQSSISKQTTSRIVERMGFRNFGSGTLTLSNLELNFNHPIYKIDKMMLCYYKKIKINGSVKTILCRHDITPLVKLNSEKALLNANWNEFNHIMSDVAKNEKKIATIHQLAQYKFAVVGYDMYSKTIGGWGEQYSWLSNSFAVTKTSTLIENLIAFMEEWDPAGEDFNYYTEGEEGDIVSFNIEPYKSMEDIRKGDSPIISVFGDDKTKDKKAWYITLFDGISAWVSQGSGAKVVTHFTIDMKSVFFECEYTGFVEGATEISKDFHDGDITHNDQVANPLTYTESDGIFEKEKVNRMGNAAWTITQRTTDFNSIYKLGDVDAINDEDRIIYRRSVAVYNDFFMVNYSECEDFVMKNYFTSVFSKKRPYQLGSFGEWVDRREVRNQQILLSTSTSMYNGESYKMNFAGGQSQFLKSILSFFESSNLDSEFKPIQKMNTSFFRHGTDTYLCDSQKYISGYSLCFGVSMCDSASAGVYIRQMMPDYGKSIDEEWRNIWNNGETVLNQNVLTDMKGEINNITGAIQDWNMLTDGSKAGYIKELSFCIGDKKERFTTGYKKAESKNVTNDIMDYHKNHLMKLPLVNYPSYDKSPVLTSSLTSLPKNIRKDGKEKLSFTFQFEPVCDERNQIAFSEYMMMLSDLNGMKVKFGFDQNIPYEIKLKASSIKTKKKMQTGVSSSAYADFFTDGLSLDVIIPNFIMSKKNLLIPVNKTFQFNKITNPDDIDKKINWSTGGARYAYFVIMFGSITVNSITINSGSVIANITKQLSFKTAEYMSNGGDGTLDRSITYVDGGIDRVKNETSDVILFNEFTSSAKRYYSPEGIDYVKDRQTSKGSSLYSYMMFTSDDNMNYDFEENPSYPNYFLAGNYQDTYETISLTDTILQNLIYSIGERVTPDTKYEKLNELPNYADGTISWKHDDNGAEYLNVVARPSTNKKEGASIRLYYLEDGMYNLVFAVQIDHWDGDKAIGKKVYVSLVDDRSRTVYDQECEPTYRTANFTKDFSLPAYLGFETILDPSSIILSTTLFSRYMMLDGTSKQTTSLTDTPDDVSTISRVWIDERPKPGHWKENAIKISTFRSLGGTITKSYIEWDITNGSETIATKAYPQGMVTYPDSSDSFIIMPEGMGIPARGIEITISLNRGFVTVSIPETAARYGDGRRYCLPKNPSGE